ncbi:MAG: hypothetical protein M3171_07235 [Actinomycetota bacterium]|nr:hypothetical protein [Actinomycetota bacterium]
MDHSDGGIDQSVVYAAPGHVLVDREPAPTSRMIVGDAHQVHSVQVCGEDREPKQDQGAVVAGGYTPFERLHRGPREEQMTRAASFGGRIHVDRGARRWEGVPPASKVLDLTTPRHCAEVASGQAGDSGLAGDQ